MKNQLANSGDLRSFSNAIMIDLERASFDCEIKNASIHRQKSRYKKKFLVMDTDLSDVAARTFLANNEEVLQTQIPDNLCFNEIFGEARDFITEALRRFTHRNDESCDLLSMKTLLSLWRFGPGSSNGVDGSHFAEKIAQPMTCTLRAAPLVKMIRYITPRLRLHDEAAADSGIRIVSGSLFCSVPKNDETERGIAIEPSGNMALQLAAGLYIEGALRSVGLNISSNESQALKNKELARKGSISGLLSTIDLRSASDLISRPLIKALWPSEWYSLFDCIRSEVISVQLAGEEREVKLNMMSTMGNGFTFPMMTLTLLAICYGVLRQQTAAKRYHIDYESVGVFGDDIVVPTFCFSVLSDVLHSVGLSVNLDKSYSSGPFRESCGGDYYAGVEITPFYVKSLSTPSEVYAALNMSLSWSARCSVPLWNLWSYLIELLDEVLLVPEWHDPSSGVLTSQCPRSFLFLDPKKQRRVIKQNLYSVDLHVLCVLGGYLESNISGTGTHSRETASCRIPSRANSYYLPRAQLNEYRVKKARIPEGYTDGRDCLVGSRERSSLIACWVEILTG